MKALAAAVILIALGMTGCTGSPMSPSSRSDGSTVQPSFSLFSDIPVPAGASMDMERSLLLGTGDLWTGRLVFSTNNGHGRVFDFYKTEMPGFGWQEITSVRASISIQTWKRGPRVATIQIRDSLFSTEVILTMAPMEGTVSAMPSGMSSSAPVSVRPL